MTYDLGIIKRQRYNPPSNTATVTGAVTTSFTQDGVNYTAHVFTSSGALLLSTGVIAEYFIVGGGGAGGGANTDGSAGGGGAGGITTGTIGLVGNTNYTITVGAGGGGRLDSTGTLAGSSSIAGSGISIVAPGGGFGSANGVSAGTGGSGGGAHQGQPTPGGRNTGTFSSGGGPNTAVGYANTGGGSTAAALYGAGGGGGAGSVGVTGTTTFGGSGGTGTFTTIISTTVGISLGIGQYITATNALYFAGGGGGSSYVTTMGGGGLGGGAPAGVINSTGTRYTGGGGGGAYAAAGGSPTGFGGSGGSGVVIVRYPSFSTSSVLNLSQSLALQSDSNFNKNSLLLSNGAPSVSTYTTSGSASSSIAIDYLIVGGGGGGGGTTSTIANPGGGGGGAGGVLSTSSFTVPGYNPSMVHADVAYANGSSTYPTSVGGWVNVGTDFTGTNFIWQYDNRGTQPAAKTSPLIETTLAYFEIYCGPSVVGPYSGQTGNRALLIGLLRNSQTVTSGWTGMYLFDGTVYVNDVAQANPLSAYASGDVMNIAYDPINNKQWFGRNGVWQTGRVPGVNAGWDIAGTGPLVLGFSNQSSNSSSMQGVIRTSSANNYVAPTGYIPYNNVYILTSSTWTITVGAGGAGGTSSASPTSGANGQNSSISFSNTNIIAYGGGSGGASLPTSSAGGTGGSGGGGSYNTGGGVTVVGQGNVGAPTAAAFSAAGATTSTGYPGGGGGGAGTAGSWSFQSTSGGDGGRGTYTSIVTATTAVALGLGQYVAGNLYVGGGGAGSGIYTGGAGAGGGGGSGSVSFNGSNQYLSVSNNSAFDFGTGDFTVEFWIYCTTAWTSMTNPGVVGKKSGDAGNGWQIYRNQTVSAGVMNIRVIGFNDYPATAAPATNVWEHWAVVRSAGTLTWYRNGTAAGSYSGVTGSISDTAPLNIGYTQTWGGYFGSGYLSNIRIVKGLAVYTGAFTPPTRQLQITQTANPYGGSNTAAISTASYVSFLLNAQSPTFFTSDSSLNNLSVTNSGAGAATYSTQSPTFTLSGIQYTGGGGGGASTGTVAGSGGSGMVVVRYPNTIPDATYTAGAATYINTGGYKTYIFTATGTLSFASSLTYSTSSYTLYLTTSTLNNTSFVDTSYNYTPITVAGTPAQGSFSPFGQNWSTYFNGSTDYLTIPYNSAYDIPPSTPVCFEAWVYTNSASTFTMACRNWTFGSGGPTWAFSLNGGVTPQWNFAGTGSATYILAVSAISGTLGQWNHYAFTRDASNVCRIFVNGVLGTSRTDSSSMTSASGSIFMGAPSNTANYSNGYMSNVRFVVGSAVYTTDFTPPNAPLPVITNTKLLTCASGRFMDKNSTSTVTASGTPNVQKFSPYPPVGVYNKTYNSGSAYFNGSSDYLSIASSNNFAIGTGIFTFEAWIYPVASSGSIFETAGGMQIGYQSTTQFGIAQRGVAWRVFSSTAPTLNTWSHVAVVRSGTGANQTFVFINGVLAATGTNSDNYGTTAGTAIVGAGSALFSGGGGFFNSYISSLRIVKGTALYTSSFVPQDAPLLPIDTTTSTSLLLNFNNSAIVDYSGNVDIVTSSTAILSSLQSKFNPYSIKFNGTSDYLSIPNYGNNNNYNWSAGDSTIEAWIYPTAYTAPIISKSILSSASTNDWELVLNASGNVIFRYVGNAAGVTLTSASAVSLNAWSHVAFTYSASPTRLNLFINGAVAATTYTLTTPVQNTLNIPINIGASRNGSLGVSTSYFAGYIDDVRFTRALRYSTSTVSTSTVTIPTNKLQLR